MWTFNDKTSSAPVPFAYYGHCADWDAMPDADDDGAPDDGGRCPAPLIWRYDRPGCGVDAHIVCGVPWGDACMGVACGCDGKDLTGCDFFLKPFAHRGSCTPPPDANSGG
jgi:hypothetical protein